MPRFFFDLLSDSGEVIERDQNGGEFPDLERAVKDAEAGLGDMVSEAIVGGEEVVFAAIVIRDAENRTVEILRLDADGKTVLRDA